MVWPYPGQNFKVRLLALLWVGGLPFVQSDAQAEEMFAIKKIKIGPQVLTVEVADTPAKRDQGLMYRGKLESSRGMIFIFDREQVLNFWMKNTFIPLSIGFFDKDRRLVSIQDMDPVTSEMQQSVPTYSSGKRAQYALEVNRGWFTNKKIKLGTQFRFLSK